MRGRAAVVGLLLMLPGLVGCVRHSDAYRMGYSMGWTGEAGGLSEQAATENGEFIADVFRENPIEDGGLRSNRELEDLLDGCRRGWLDSYAGKEPAVDLSPDR